MAAAVVLALGLVGAAGWWVAHDRETSAAGSARAVNQTDRDVAEVTQALRRLSSDPAALMAQGARASVEGNPSEALPPGTKVSVDERSWRPDGVGGGMILVEIAVPGTAPRPYAAVMVREQGLWKILATIPVTGSAPSGETAPSASGGTS